MSPNIFQVDLVEHGQTTEFRGSQSSYNTVDAR